MFPKKNIVVVCFLVLSVSCSSKKTDEKLDTDLIKNPISANANSQNNLPNIKFEVEKYDFGNLKQGEIKTTEFVFTNCGTSDLIIEDAKGSCGCTVPVFPKEPIKPGETERIKVTFNSEGKHGIQNKSVTLITNCIPSTKFLAIKANVISEK
jgi:Protein of unknown function (DUF1573)